MKYQHEVSDLSHLLLLPQIILFSYNVMLYLTLIIYFKEVFFFSQNHRAT